MAHIDNKGIKGPFAEMEMRFVSCIKGRTCMENAPNVNRIQIGRRNRGPEGEDGLRRRGLESVAVLFRAIAKEDWRVMLSVKRVTIIDKTIL